MDGIRGRTGIGMLARTALAALLLGAAACEIDPTAPGRRGGGVGGGPDNTLQVSGEWVYNATILVNDGVSCRVSDLVLTFQQSDSTFTGTYADGEAVCAVVGFPPDTLDLGAGVVLNGVVRGDSVIFDLDTPDWRNRGRVSGSSMSGEVTVRFDLGPPIGPVFVFGPFGAVKR